MYIYYILTDFYIIKIKWHFHTFYILSQAHFAVSHGIKISKYIIFSF